MKLIFISSGSLPLPPVRGGAVENLVENIIVENELSMEHEIICLSSWDKKAVQESKDRHKYCSYRFIKNKKIDNIKVFVKKIIRKITKIDFNEKKYYIKRINKKLKKLNYDYVIVENSFEIYKGLKADKKRLYLHLHNSLSKKLTEDDLLYIKNTKGIICVSEYVKKTILNYDYSLDDKLHVLLNGIDSEMLIKSYDNEFICNYKKQHNFSENDFIIVFVGRVDKMKGIKNLVDAIKELPENIKLLIIGSAWYGQNILDETMKYVLEVANQTGRIFCTGFIPYNEVGRYYSIGDLACLPSIVEDSCPLAVIEAITLGLPIISTKSGGIPELISHMENGILLDKDHNLTTQIRESIQYLQVNKFELNRMATNSKKIAKKFTRKDFYYNLMKILNNN